MGKVHNMATVRPTVVRRVLGNPAVLASLERQVSRHPERPPRIDPDKLNQLVYSVSSRGLDVGGFCLTELDVVFPPEFFPGSTLPYRFGWLVAGRSDVWRGGSVLELRHYFGEKRPFGQITCQEEALGLSVQARVLNLETLRYQRLETILAIGSDGALEVRGALPAPDEAIVASALEFVRLVGEGHGIAMAIRAMNESLAQEARMTMESRRHIGEDLGPLATVIEEIAERSDPAVLDPARPLAAVTRRSRGSSGRASARIARVLERIHRVYFNERWPSPQWEGSPLTEARFRQLVAEGKTLEEERKLARLFLGHCYDRLSLRHGLFDSIGELNNLSRAAGRQNYAELAYACMGIEVNDFREAARRYLDRTKRARDRVIGALKGVALEGRLAETDVSRCTSELFSRRTDEGFLPLLSLQVVLKALDDFWTELGFNLGSPSGRLFYDLFARPGKRDRFQTVGISWARSLITGSLPSDRVDFLDDVPSLAHEQLHHFQNVLGSRRVGNSSPAAQQDPYWWVEGLALAWGGIVLEPHWIRRYLRSLTQAERDLIITAAQLQTEFAVWDTASLIGQALFEIGLYDDTCPWEERLAFWPNFVRENLGPEVDDDPRGWMVWMTTKYVTRPGSYGAYLYGWELGKGLVETVLQALGRDDEKALKAAGDRLRQILEMRPWLTTEAEIRRALGST